MKGSQTLSLRKTHPTLFKALVIKSVMLVMLGIIFSAGFKQYIFELKILQTARIVPLEFWGGIYLVNGLMLMYGISNGVRRYRWARRALIVASSLAGLFCVGYIFAIAQGLTDRLLAPLFWGYFSASLAVWTGEPAFNPLSSALNTKGTINDNLRPD